MPKAKTLRERADAACCAVFPGLDPRDGIRIKGAKLYLAGHRANRITKAERAVVEAVDRFYNGDGTMWQIADAHTALERAKGRK